MGTISYWMLEASGMPPGALDEALRRTQLELVHEDGEWVVLVKGFPREWHETREAAERAANRWKGSVEHVPGGTWLVLTGDQYLFSSPSLPETQGFIFGVIVGNDMAHAGAPRRLLGS